MAQYKTLMSVDEVLKRFPDNLRPTKVKLEETAVESGCYHDVWGKKGFTEEDFEQLMDYIRAQPTASEAAARLGPGRLFSYVPVKGASGYMVFIGDQLGEDQSIFISYAPPNGVGDLLRLVQFGNPGHLAILHFFPATPEDVTAHLKALSQFQYRADDTNWYLRSKQVNAYITKLRDELRPPMGDENGDE